MGPLARRQIGRRLDRSAHNTALPWKVSLALVESKSDFSRPNPRSGADLTKAPWHYLR
jgi:hypothetical protein